MTHSHGEEAICDDPGALCFPQAGSDCGWISPTRLLDCLFALRAAHVPATGQFPPGNISHVSIVFPWDVHSVHEWICRPTSTCVCCRGREERAWPTLLPGAQKGRGGSRRPTSLVPDGPGRAPKAHLETPPLGITESH